MSFSSGAGCMHVMPGDHILNAKVVTHEDVSLAAGRMAHVQALAGIPGLLRIQQEVERIDRRA